MKKLGKWWTGMRLLCRDCGETFALEEEDYPRRGKMYFVEVDCPTCGGVVNVPHRPYGAEVPTVRP